MAVGHKASILVKLRGEVGPTAGRDSKSRVIKIMLKERQKLLEICKTFDDPDFNVEMGLPPIEQYTDEELILTSEIIHTSDVQIRTDLMRILHQYIVDNFSNDNNDVIVAVGCAIRHYISMCEIQPIVDLVKILNGKMCMRHQVEVAKMIYRKFEARPPETADANLCFVEYLKPTIDYYLLPENHHIFQLDGHGPHSAVFSLSFEALIASRSLISESLVDEFKKQCVQNPQLNWVFDMIRRNIKKLSDRWNENTDYRPSNPSAAHWAKNLFPAEK